MDKKLFGVYLAYIGTRTQLHSYHLITTATLSIGDASPRFHAEKEENRPKFGHLLASFHAPKTVKIRDRKPSNVSLFCGSTKCPHFWSTLRPKRSKLRQKRQKIQKSFWVLFSVSRYHILCTPTRYNTHYFFSHHQEHTRGLTFSQVWAASCS